MKELITALILVAICVYSCCSQADLTAQEAGKLSKRKYNKEDAIYKKYCRRGIMSKIRLAAKKGDFYVHISDPAHCVGNSLEEVSLELRDKGYQTDISSAGLEKIHYIQILTVGW